MEIFYKLNGNFRFDGRNGKTGVPPVAVSFFPGNFRLIHSFQLPFNR